jgi:ABC-2 type transport system ATP-binding protein
MVKNLVALGKTVWLTTHFMDEAQYLADRVAVIAKGVIVAEGPPSSLAGRDQMQTTIRFRPAPGAPAPPELGQIADGDGVLRLSTDQPARRAHELTGWAIDHGVELDVFEITRPSLEDVYLELTDAEEGPA